MSKDNENINEEIQEEVKDTPETELEVEETEESQETEEDTKASEEKADTLNDPQKDLLKEYGKRVDLEAILKDNSLKDMIMDYPCLNTDEKKKLIKNMEERNNMVLSAIR